MFEPLAQTQISGQGSNDTSGVIDLELSQAGVEARGQRTSDGFVVLSGSRIKIPVMPSCPKNAVKQREINASRIDSEGILREDILLSSANEAACFVVGGSISGIANWKTADGRTLKELQASEADQL